MDDSISRRRFSHLFTATAAAAIAPAVLIGDPAAAAQAVVGGAADAGIPSPSTDGETLQSELLMDLTLDRGAVSNVESGGIKRAIVAIAGGTFQGPRLRGTIVGPSGDWIVARPDGSSVVDIRAVLQTDDQQKIYMSCRGISYPMPGGALNARILPLFETGAARYGWLNNVVAVGVYRPTSSKLTYRVFRIL
jgi:hypothetical protein